ncbi:MAG TPA: 16S rRNA (guanine(966)-N(2))-methyltransferase RsmD [Steroidobacteraceae bacterium]|nr:16S rRNA (guanine(966)-N(2))-methyltransferase RsmD [Steroidobacteraceae bacterium]
MKNGGKSRAPTAHSEGPDARKHDAPVGARAAVAGPRILRIIGGRHRGRRLRFPAGVEIRPTPDRVRETLFNWLQPRMDGARVLDLFAGSGALGLEALSRGAGQVTFVERDRRAAAAISQLLAEWREVAGTVVCADALGWLESAASPPFDIVFLDPPYDAALLGDAAVALAARGLLASDARVYLERRASDVPAALPDGWRELRAGRAGEVGYHLFSV